jgi:tetratricopeptide (TPR) repeat protein
MRLPAVLIVLLACALYLPFVSHPFIALDDGPLIIENPAVKAITGETLRAIFTSYDPELYIPLTFLSYQLNYALAGLQPWIYHVSNLLLHIGSALLVLGIVTKLSGSLATGALTALLFTSHPIQTEAVLWASARKDTLSSFFFLLAMWLYLRPESARPQRVALVALAFLLGLLAKVSVITFPFVLLLIDWYQGKRIDRRTLLGKIPYFLLVLLFGIIAFYGKRETLSDAGPLVTLLLALKGVVYALGKVFIPLQFSVFYPQVTPVTLSTLEFLVPLFSILALAGFTAWVFFVRSQHPLLRLAAFSASWYVLTVLPNATNIMKSGLFFFSSDRSVYLAAIGIFFLVARIAQRTRMAVLVSAVLLFTLAPLTALQAHTWKSSEALFRHATTLYPSCAICWNSLGHVLHTEQGRSEEALVMFREAYRLEPTFIRSITNIGNVEHILGNSDAAIDAFQKAIAIVEQRGARGLDDLTPYYYLGEIEESLGHDAAALSHFIRATEIGGRFGEPFFNLGIQYHKRGRTEEAVIAYRAALERDPLYIPAHYHLAALYAERGKLDAAIPELQEVLRLDPGHTKAREHLENIRQLKGL